MVWDSIGSPLCPSPIWTNTCYSQHSSVIQMLWGLFKLYCIIVLWECTLIVPHQRVLLDLIEAEGQEEGGQGIIGIINHAHIAYFVLHILTLDTSAVSISDILSIYQTLSHATPSGAWSSCPWSGSTRLGWINYYGNHRWLLFKLRRCLPACLLPSCLLQGNIFWDQKGIQKEGRQKQ